MPNAAHILETALLILVAFLVGCVVGYLARRLAQRGRVSRPVVAASSAEPAFAGPPLVTAPAIAPLPGTRRRTAAERLAAAAGRSPIDEPVIPSAVEPVAPPAVPVAAPAEPTEAVVVPPPPPPASTAPEESPASAVLEVPPPEPVPALVPSEPAVVITEVPTIEADHPGEQPQAETATEAAIRQPEPPSSPDAVPAPPEPVAAAAAEMEPVPVTRTALEDPEAAAMRAIEGNWTPRRRAAHSPVPHPEQAAAAREVDDAMQAARSAVAAAAAAAAAAIAEAQERPHRPPSEGLSFEQRTEAMAKSFLESEDELPTDPASGLSFEPEHPVVHHSFGRPEALPGPRDGRPDNLKQIKGITASLEASLHGLGIFHFDQIAAWDQKAIVWIEQHLSLHGRIGRDRWLEQARDLSVGRSQKLRPVRR